MKSLLKFFSSVKLAIVLLIIITLASMLGTLIPQQRSPDEYAARYGQLAGLFTGLQLTKLYHSWWFVLLLCFFSLNIIVCTLNRLPAKLRKAFRPRLEIGEKEITALKTREKFRKKMSLGPAREELKRELSSRRYRIKESERENRVYFLARKKILGWFGADLVHLGLLIILAGGITSGLGGFREDLTFSEGETRPVPKVEFKLRLDKFETEYYPDGSIRDWKSTLTVLEREKPVLSKVIEVNHPLSYKGFIFYQSSYGWDWEKTLVEILIKKRTDPSFLRKMEIKVGERAGLEGENIQISLLHFIPDFIINEKSEVATRSLQPNNPAAFIEGWKEDEKIFSGWIFARFPDFSRIHSSKETDLSFELKNFKSNQFSVIQAAVDPGVNLIWLGCALLMTGLSLAFYWPAREIRVILEESNSQTGVIAGGKAAKAREAFESEFKEIMASLRREK
jgi:cytochrome c biogenesis protein